MVNSAYVHRMKIRKSRQANPSKKNKIPHSENNHCKYFVVCLNLFRHALCLLAFLRLHGPAFFSPGFLILEKFMLVTTAVFFKSHSEH